MENVDEAIAVWTFSGSTADAAVTSRISQLVRDLKSSNWKVAGEPTAFFYNPPWTIPFLRTNEVLVPVTK